VSSNEIILPPGGKKGKVPVIIQAIHHEHMLLPRVEVGKNTSTVIPASRKRDGKGTQ
jgi:hypothetical protein